MGIGRCETRNGFSVSYVFGHLLGKSPQATSSYRHTNFRLQYEMVRGTIMEVARAPSLVTAKTASRGFVHTCTLPIRVGSR